MLTSSRWVFALVLFVLAACAPAAVNYSPAITRVPDYVDATGVEITASSLTITGKTNLRDDVCLSTRLIQNDRAVTWWPEKCMFPFAGRLRISVPFGKAGVPASLEPASRYVFQVEVKEAGGIGDTLAFESPATPTPRPIPTAAPTVIITPEPAPQATATPVANPLPAPPFDASLPSIRFVSGNALIEQDARGGRRTLVELPEAGAIRDAVQIGESVLIWRAGGLQRVNVASSGVELAVPFEKPAASGEVLLAPNGRTAIYTINESDACTNSASPTVIGQYRLDTGATRTIFTASQLVNVIGLSGDGSTMYLQPVNCEGTFTELWAVSLLTGKIVATLPAQDEANGAVGQTATWLSPGSRYLAFGAGEVVGLYDLGLEPPQLSWLAIPPSVAWLEDTRWLYFLRDGALFRYELNSGESVELGKVPASATRLRYATADGSGLVLTDDATHTVVYFDVKQKTALEAPLPAEGPVLLVMEQ